MADMMNPGGVRMQKARALGKLMSKGSTGKPVNDITKVGLTNKAKGLKNFEKGSPAFERGKNGWSKSKKHGSNTGSGGYAG